MKCPKFYDFHTKHCVNPTYHFTYLSVYNLTAYGTLQLKMKRLDLSGSQFLKWVKMIQLTMYKATILLKSLYHYR